MDTTVATIQKNQTEQVRITLTEFGGHQLIDARVYCHPHGDPDRAMIATKRGLSVRVELLPLLIAALQAAERKALEAGLLAGEKAA